MGELALFENQRVNEECWGTTAELWLISSHPHAEQSHKRSDRYEQSVSNAMHTTPFTFAFYTKRRRPAADLRLTLVKFVGSISSCVALENGISIG